MAQTNLSDYSPYSAKAFPGELYGIEENIVESLTATAVVPFGAPVAMDTDETCTVVNNVADKFRGVAIKTFTKEYGEYRQYDRVSVLSFGRIWVTAAVAVAKGDLAYVTAAGAYTNVASTNILVGEFFTSAGIGAVAVLSVRKAVQ